MTRITVLGASGFIGSHISEVLRQRDLEYSIPAREEDLSGRDLGSVIYAIGLTADFRSKPLETVSAHVCRLLDVIKNCRFDSLIYLSSTRLYGPGSASADEEDPITVRPLDPGDLYNISKAMGESLALTATEKSIVVRLSNVYGPDSISANFLSDIIRAALKEKKITFATALASEKDYVDVAGVANVLVNMATRQCSHRIYNVARGSNRSNQTLADRISALTGCKIEVAPHAPNISYPQIKVSRVKQEFDFEPSDVLNDMEKLVNFYRGLDGESR
jgi:nucleoside-diphosphate-sugar epimerase